MSLLKTVTSTGEPSRHILVCDDERHIVRLIQVNLERQGYEVETAFDGREALAKMRARRPDLLVLDTLMPVMSGWEVLEEMAQDPALRDIPVVLLGGNGGDGDDEGPGPSGPRPPNVRLYLTKPFHPMRLLEALE
jgi:two-component system alkaline phosphatase synthesis response regulator PhoP/two-component system response regulator VicR